MHDKSARWGRIWGGMRTFSSRQMARQSQSLRAAWCQLRLTCAARKRVGASRKLKMCVRNSSGSCVIKSTCKWGRRASLKRTRQRAPVTEVLSSATSAPRACSWQSWGQLRNIWSQWRTSAGLALPSSSTSSIGSGPLPADISNGSQQLLLTAECLFLQQAAPASCREEPFLPVVNWDSQRKTPVVANSSVSQHPKQTISSTTRQTLLFKRSSLPMKSAGRPHELWSVAPAHLHIAGEQMGSLRAALALLAALAAAARGASGSTELFVDAIHGTDVSSGGSREAPLRTLAFASSRALALGPNVAEVVLQVAPGLYTDSIAMDCTALREAPRLFFNATADGAVLSAAVALAGCNITVSGFAVNRTSSSSSSAAPLVWQLAYGNAVLKRLACSGTDLRVVAWASNVSLTDSTLIHCGSFRGGALLTGADEANSQWSSHNSIQLAGVKVAGHTGRLVQVSGGVFLRADQIEVSSSRATDGLFSVQSSGAQLSRLLITHADFGTDGSLVRVSGRGANVLLEHTTLASSQGHSALALVLDRGSSATISNSVFVDNGAQVLPPLFDLADESAALRVEQSSFSCNRVQQSSVQAPHVPPPANIGNGTIQFSDCTEANCTVACPPGAYKLGLQCLQCTAGSFSAEWSTSECTRCSPGYYAADDGALQCSACAGGSIAVGSGATMCQSCANSFITSEIGATTCDQLTTLGLAVAGTAAALVTVPLLLLLQQSRKKAPKETEMAPILYNHHS
eukprot:m.155668 g.155668  ORF g.155668 m.155668 type:complete len:742 (+) comp10205_c0_seq3:1701-3926(+)